MTHTAFLDHLLCDPAVGELIGTQAELAAMLRFEVELTQAAADVGLIGRAAADAVDAAGATFRPDTEALAASTLRDGVVVPGLVKQFKAHVGAPYADAVHFGATSQDVIDTSLAMKLKPVFSLFESRLSAILAVLDGLIGTHGENRLMGRTRMQAAIPITVADRLKVWRGLVERTRTDLAEVAARNLILSLAGAAGTSDKFGSDIDAVRKNLAGLLGLSVPDHVPHAARDRIVALGNWLSQISGALGKIGQDIALMAQNEIAEIELSGGGTSSAMAHKQNPVRAEVLVTLARFNAVQVSGLHQSMVHEQERSGAAWTLEWMILPGMLNATGMALVHADALLRSIKRIGRDVL